MKDRVSESGVIEDRELAEYYSLMAKRYMRIPCQRVLSRIKTKGIERGKALDVGTGPGIFPIFLSKALPNIQFKAIDLSPVMVEIARKNSMEAGLGDGIDTFDGAKPRFLNRGNGSTSLSTGSRPRVYRRGSPSRAESREKRRSVSTLSIPRVPVLNEVEGSDRGVEGVDFQMGSAYSLPCEDHSLDLLLCINTLHHLDRPVDFFNEVARSLKDGGSFVIVDFHRDTSFIFVGIFNLFWKFFFGKHPEAKRGFLE
jgi:ubiquinone/menaquinone biosynthesis C-methylase UbiE